MYGTWKSIGSLARGHEERGAEVSHLGNWVANGARDRDGEHGGRQTWRR